MKKYAYFMVAAGGLLAAVVLFTDCAGLQGLKRHTGPEYKAETKSWMQVVQNQGGNGMWLVTRGYHPGDDVVAIATAAARSVRAMISWGLWVYRTTSGGTVRSWPFGPAARK